MNISGCIICKDEEENIEGCLNSIKEICDEIIVVDTGSHDRTIEIAKTYTEKIYFTTWDGDFSKARNYSLDRATGEWILVIDCDEYLEEVNKEILIDTLKNGDKEGYCLLSSEGNGSKEFLLCRLFKNKSEYRYKNKLHEQIIHSIGFDKVDILSLRIFHKGYSNDAIKRRDKINRNLDILMSYSVGERDCFYYYSLGNMLFEKGEFKEAKVAYLDALSIYSDPYGFTEGLFLNLRECYMMLNEREEVERLEKAFPQIFS